MVLGRTMQAPRLPCLSKTLVNVKLDLASREQKSSSRACMVCVQCAAIHSALGVPRSVCTYVFRRRLFVSVTPRS